MKKIGIPRALLYYKYYPLWKAFFESLGFDVCVSEKTTRYLFEEGLRSSLDEFCLPVKIFHGHVQALKAKVDHIFIPRLICVEKKPGGKAFTCPKMIGLPDLIKASISDLPPIVPMTIDLGKEPLFISFYKTGRWAGKSIFDIIHAFRRALVEQKRFEMFLIKGLSPSEAISVMESEKIESTFKLHKAKFRVALISHPYNVCENYINMDMIKILKDFKVNAIGIEALSKEKIRKEADALFPDLSWSGERELLGGASLFAKERSVDGMILITSFGCGPGSLVSEYVRAHVRQFKMPFMSLTVDEHSGRAGVKTRLEAFIEMLERKKGSELLSRN